MTSDINRHTKNMPPLAEEIEKLLPELRGFAWSLCRDRSLMDDLVQDACMKAWSAADTLKPGLAVKPWLFQILRNEWRQYQRRAWRTQLASTEEIEQDLISHSNAEASADSIKATDAIYNLPEQYRDAVILILAAGMTYEEAATILDCSVGTVKSRLSRARKALLTDLQHGVPVPLSSKKNASKTSYGLEKMIERANQLIQSAEQAA